MAVITSALLILASLALGGWLIRWGVKGLIRLNKELKEMKELKEGKGL